MSRTALALAAAALVAAGLASPGLYLAIGLGVAAIGFGWVGFRRKTSPGASRLAGAAAVTLGLTGVMLGALRVALTLAAIGKLDRMIGG